MGNMKIGNYIISALGVILGIAIAVMASEFKIEFGDGDPGAGFWPMALGIIIIALSVLLLITTLTKKKEMEEKTFTISTPANMRVYLIMAVVVGFCVVLYFLGFYIGAALFIPIVMYIMEVKNPKKIAITTIATVIGIYVIFGMGLKISLPAPFFLE